MALFRASDGSGSSTLVFSPESQTCSLYITAGGAIMNSTGPSKRILFEVRLTHPDYMIATPRDGSLLSSGDEEVIVVLQLINTQNLDLALLTEAPMRVMIIGTTSGQHSDPPVTQKLKLLCDSDSIRRSCAVLASANNKGVVSSMESLGDAKRSGGMGASTPRSAAPAPVLERKASGNQLSTMSPPPSSSSASVLTAAPSRVTPPTTAPPPQAVVPPLPTAAEGASPPPRQLVVGTTKGSGNATATTANTFDYSHYDVPSGDATKFQLMMTLHRLVFPEGSVSMPHQTGMLCCIQWKRLTSSGVTGWHRVERPAGSSSSLVCSLEDEIIDVPNCDVSLEKRVTLALGIVTVDEGRPTETFLRGTLKLDTSKPLENNTSSSSTSEQTAAVFPLTIDGKGGATLVATLVTRTEARHVLVDQTPIKTVDPSSRSDTPTTQKTVSSSDPTMVSPATAGAAAAPMLDETPRSRTAATVAGATGSKYADPLSSLSALKMQIESLEAMRPPLPPPSSSSTSSVPSPMFNASVSGMGGASSPLMPADIATNPLRSFEKQMPKSSNVQVAVRIRPTLPFESPSQKPVWTYDTRAIRSTANDREYQYDYVFAPDTTTKGVFDALCPPFVDNALLGINGTIFMYGQTASGKTHTMFGGEKEAGITPKVIEHLFQEIQKKKAEESNVQVNVSACYFEIYNEELNDLLDMSKKNLQIRSSGAADGGFTVDVSSFPVASAEEALQVLLHGSYNKKVGQSHLNDRSSRSHSIFKLGIEVVTFDPLIKVGSGSGTKASKGIKTTAELCLVDLAGSETLQDKGGASQRKETTNINLSLTYLKKVIWELAHKEKHVSYRNSTLTKVLKQAIGGNSRTCVVCCITPAEEHYRDSRNTLVFGTTAKSVVTTTRVNTSGDANAESEKLKMEMSRLRAQLEAYEATVTAYARIEDDFRKVLQENAAFAEQVERLEAENAELRQNASMFGSTSEDTALRRGEQQRPPAAGTDSQSTGDGDGDEDDAHAPRAAPRFTIPNVTASRASAVLRADAVQHAALLEEAISRLADATEGADLDTTLTQEAGPDSSALDERALDEDDLFDEVDAHSAASGTPRTASVGPSNAGASSGDASKLVSSTNRPPAPKRRPPAVKTERPNLANATVAVPRTVESLQLQLVQQTIDHRSEMLKKEDEIRRILEQQVRPTDEIPEIMKKEEKVCVLLDQLHSFLHHGTPMTVVTTVEAPLVGLDSGSMVGAKLPKQAPRFSRVFMYLYTFNQTFLCFCHVDFTDPKLPKRSSCFEKIPIKDIKRVELGQYSDSFEKLKTWTATNNNEGDVEYAETCKKVQSRHRMSFSVVVKKGRSFDLVCEDEADFEAWVIELNRLLGTSAEWKHSLDISEMEFFDALEPEEKKFCASMHVHPDEYIRAKTKMLKRKEKFVTLFDVRSLAQFDLYHSQRFFYFLRCQGWVSQAALFYLTDKFVASAQADLDVL